MIHLIKGLLIIKFPRRVLRGQPAQGGENVLLVQRNPVFHLTPESCKQSLCVIYIIVNNLPAFPALIFVDKSLRQVPVINRHHRLNSVFQTLINDILIKCNALFIYFSCAFRINSGP